MYEPVEERISECYYGAIDSIQNKEQRGKKDKN